MKQITGLALLGCLAATAAAQATPMTLTIVTEDLTTLQTFTSTYTDASTQNAITVPAASTGGISYTGEVGVSTIGPPLNTLITSALTITNTSAHAFSVNASLVGFGFVGPDNQVSLTGSGTWFGTPGSIMNLSFYDDPTDTGLATSAQRVGGFTSTPALNPTSSYAYSPGTTPLSVPDLGLFSMTESWSYTLAAGGELVSRGQTETKGNVVPEPNGLVMLGLGVLGIGLIARHRQLI